MTESLCIRHSFQNRSQDSQRKTSRKQPWNWRPSAVPSLCRSKPSLSYTEGHMSSKVCRSPRQLKELQTGTKGRSLQQGREGSWKQLQETLLGTKLKKELSMPDARWHRHVIHLTATLGYDLKGNYNVCRSTVFVFQLSATTARKCELRLGEEGVQRRSPCPLPTCPARRQCLTVQICQTPKVFYAAVEDQMHYLQRWQMYWTNLTTLRYKSHQGFFGVRFDLKIKQKQASK